MRTAVLILTIFVGGSVFGQCRTLQQVPLQSAGYSYQQSLSYTVPASIPVPVPTPSPCLPPVLTVPPTCAPCQTGMVGAAYGLGYQQQPVADYSQLLAYMQAALSQQQTYYQPPALPSPTFATGYYQQSQSFLPSAGYTYPSRSFGVNYIPTRTYLPPIRSFPIRDVYAGDGFGSGYIPRRDFPVPVPVPVGGHSFGGGFGSGLFGQFQQGVQTGGLAGGLERFTGLGNGSGQFVGGALTGILATRANLFGLGNGGRGGR